MQHGVRKRPLVSPLSIGVAVMLVFPGCMKMSPAGGVFGFGAPEAEPVCEIEAAVQEAEQAALFRRAETERAKQLSNEISRLQADLETAESTLVEVESGLLGSSTRADAVSSLAVTRIQVERAARRAPWRHEAIGSARRKLEEAERQVEEGRLGAALFFVYRATRVAENVLEEARQVRSAGDARMIEAKRVNLRSGPSVDQPILSVLERGTLVIPQTREGAWALIQVAGGPAGWLHESLLGEAVFDESPSIGPAASKP